jgi:hypothetical protein
MKLGQPGGSWRHLDRKGGLIGEARIFFSGSVEEFQEEFFLKDHC